MNVTYRRNLLRDLVKYKKAQWRIEQQLEIALKLDDETIQSEVSAFCASAAADPTDPDVTPLLQRLLSLSALKQESEAQREQQQSESHHPTTGHDASSWPPDNQFPGQFPETD